MVQHGGGVCHVAFRPFTAPVASCPNTFGTRVVFEQHQISVGGGGGKSTWKATPVLVQAVALTGVSLFFLCATGTRLYQFVVELAEFQYRGRKSHEVVRSWEYKHGGKARGTGGTGSQRWWWFGVCVEKEIPVPQCHPEV